MADKQQQQKKTKKCKKILHYFVEMRFKIFLSMAQIYSASLVVRHLDAIIFQENF